MEAYSVCGSCGHNTVRLNSRFFFFLRHGETRKSPPENSDETKGINSISEGDHVSYNFFLLCVDSFVVC